MTSNRFEVSTKEYGRVYSDGGKLKNAILSVFFHQVFVDGLGHFVVVLGKR